MSRLLEKYGDEPKDKLRDAVDRFNLREVKELLTSALPVETKTIRQLRAIASRLGVVGYSQMDKTKLIWSIKQYESRANQNPSDQDAVPRDEIGSQGG